MRYTRVVPQFWDRCWIGPGCRLAEPLRASLSGVQITVSPAMFGRMTLVWREFDAKCILS